MEVDVLKKVSYVMFKCIFFSNWNLFMQSCGISLQVQLELP